MRTTIDAGGRVVIPKRLRDEIGLTPGAELEIDAVDGRVEISVPSRVAIEVGPYGPRLVTANPTATSADDVRAVLERGRR